jgi:putative ABC transport system permease protein
MFVMGGGNLPLANSESLVTLAERLGQRLFGLPEVLTIAGTSVSGGSLATLALMVVLVCGLAVVLALFLGTDLGLAMRAAGNNPRMAKAVSIDVDLMVILGLGLSNGLIALSGALFAQHEGFANIQFGLGAVVTAVATLMVGEALFGKRPLGRWIAGVVAGAVIFRLLVGLAIRAGLHPNALKLVTTVFVLAVLVIPELARAARRRATVVGVRHA